ncbi:MULTISPECIES: OsmC family protein [Nonlabens]|uniref:Putative OsmC-like protein n=1 Tax=Nonlabens xylanidelens TaxID=191564 RepID=A0A2S6IGA3_9FLAO|nr:OsmC family protein [Nonlabens xylanidelens]PPK93231.1 putative OsmC-like protein [Nonlabens xylanidelens]PQJ20944.1 osmotically inducible protein OsmC [Nonlabens xylanidelens]
MTSTVEYKGNLRCESTHLKSGNSFLTDAPVDNQGKGEAFSPTDTVATGLASCMLTVMGIKAADMGIELSGSKAQVTKIMDANPRRISQIDVVLDMKGGCDKRAQLILERVGNTCPVHNSLHPDIVKNITFNWS